MITPFLRLYPISRVGLSLYKTPQIPVYNLIRRNIQEFPEIKSEDIAHRDHVLILPEPLNEQENSNEAMRLPKIGEPEIDFSKITTEALFKGANQRLRDYENFIADFVDQEFDPNVPIGQIFKDIERHLQPMDTIFCILGVLLNIKQQEYSHKEMTDLAEYYSETRKERLDKLQDRFYIYLVRDYQKISAVDKRLLSTYNQRNPYQLRSSNLDKSILEMQRGFLKEAMGRFRSNLSAANSVFSYTVDDPDILAEIMPEFDQYDLHHRERTPFKVGITTYQKFLQVCSDGFIRSILWQTYNKRCSPKASPNTNNLPSIDNMRLVRRKIANLLGYRTHVEMKLANAMAKSKKQIVENLTHLHEENVVKVNERLQELNDYASDNSFIDPQGLGIREHDVDYWTHKYTHEVIIGKSEVELKSYFPLDIVMEGLVKFFKNYLNIHLELKSSDRFWAKDILVYEVRRRDESLGTLVFDPYVRDGKRPDPIYIGMRIQNRDSGYSPLRLISTALRINPTTKRVHLTAPEIVNLFYSFGNVVQKFLFNYKYYELNIEGALELEADQLIPNLCVAHLLSDRRILQSCSDRGGSKPLDAELASRIIRSLTHFKPLQTWNKLYISHLDQEAHSIQDKTKNLAQQTRVIYSPYPHDQDNYDYCAMSEIFYGPRDGTHYADLWSKQLANFVLSRLASEAKNQDMSHAELDTIRMFNEKLLDSLFDPEILDTGTKLQSLTGTSFDHTRSSLGVL